MSNLEKVVRVIFGILNVVGFVWLANVTGVNDYDYPSRWPSLACFISAIAGGLYAIVGPFPKWLSR